MPNYMTPNEWIRYSLGKSFDTDNYPIAQKYQCWDWFDKWCSIVDIPCSRYCSLTGYVGDLWKLRYEYGYDNYFDFVNSVNQLQNGDWIFKETHVSMYYDGYQVGQNQGSLDQPNILHPYVVIGKFNTSGFLGAMRWKKWVSSIILGASDPVLNGHLYHFFKGYKNDFKIGVLSAGLNRLASIKDLDSDDIYNYAKITGANYYQMRTDLPDQPYGTTYGDLSSPINNAYQSLPNQSSTLYYDIEDNKFGDCTGVYVNNKHNVFSPSLVYPNKNGNFEYAYMVGLNHIYNSNIYTFSIRYNDSWVFGLNDSKLTPREIVNDLMCTCFINIAFLDGGGSAQMGRWNGKAFEYVRDTGRPVPSGLSMFRYK